MEEKRKIKAQEFQKNRDYVAKVIEQDEKDKADEAEKMKRYH